MEDGRPTLDDLASAREAFGTHEPRDVFYRAATDLVAMALRGEGSVNVAEALCVLLQTWNSSYYRFRPIDAEHYTAIEDLLTKHRDWLASVRTTSIDDVAEGDAADIAVVFTGFETVLGPVGAAKALHLLAPKLMPLWDRAIAKSYGLPLGPVGTNASRYVRLVEVVRQQSARIGGEAGLGRNVVKAIDEYNYCHLTKGWC